MNNYKHELYILDEWGFTTHYEKFLEHIRYISSDQQNIAIAIDPELKKYGGRRDNGRILFNTSEGYLDYLMTFG